MGQMMQGAPPWLHVVYWLAILSNLGPFSLYAIIMWKTIDGFSLPIRAEKGARHFFAGCSQAHVIMMLMLISMPLGMWLAMAPSWLVVVLLCWHLLANVEQPGAAARHTVVRHLRLLVHLPADAVTHEVADDMEAACVRMLLHRRADVTEVTSRPSRRTSTVRSRSSVVISPARSASAVIRVRPRSRTRSRSAIFTSIAVGTILVVAVAVVWRLVALRVDRPELSVLAPLGRLVIFGLSAAAPSERRSLFQNAYPGVLRLECQADVALVVLLGDHAGQLIVDDDGEGFDPKSATIRGRGIGLIGMKERAQQRELRVAAEPCPEQPASQADQRPLNDEDGDHKAPAGAHGPHDGDLACAWAYEAAALVP